MPPAANFCDSFWYGLEHNQTFLIPVCYMRACLFSWIPCLEGRTHFEASTNNRWKRTQGMCSKCRQNRSEGFALTGYDIPGCVEDGAWMLWENSSVAAVAHPDLGNGQLSVFIATSALPECADRSISSSEYRWSKN